MSDLRTLRRRASVALAIVVALVVGLTAVASAAQARALSGWLSSAPRFPARALDLYAPAGTTLTAGNVHITENGRTVSGATVTPMSAAAPGDVGVIVALQRSAAMAPGTLSAELAAARELASLRRAGQQVGIVAYDQNASLVAPLSTDGAAVSAATASIAAGGSGANPSAAISLGLATLQRAHVALGGIILISDGIGASSSDPGASAAAIAANVPVITVGLADARSRTADLAALARLGVSHTPTTAPARAGTGLALAWGVLSRGAVVRWRSTAPGGQVSVIARADGLTGTVQSDYVAPTESHPTAPARPVVRQFPSAASLRAALAGPARLGVAPAALNQTETVPATPVAPATVQPAQPEGFWASTDGLVVIMVLVALLIGAAVYLIVQRTGAESGVRSRVGVFVPGGGLLEDPEEGAGAAFKREKTGAWADFVHAVEVSRNPRTPADLVKRAGIAGVLFAALLYFGAGAPIAAALPLLGWPFALRALVKRAANKQRAKFRDGLPGYLQDLASAMRVGRTFIGAVDAVADGADEPTRSELERVVRDEQLGLPLEESLEAVAQRMEAPDMDQVALIAALNRRSGSNVAEALDRVAEGARDRADMRREARALTAQAKVSSYVLTGLPVCVLGATNLMSPQYAYPFFHTTVGFVVLGVAAVMVFMGWKVMSKISNVRT